MVAPVHTFAATRHNVVVQRDKMRHSAHQFLVGHVGTYDIGQNNWPKESHTASSLILCRYFGAAPILQQQQLASWQTALLEFIQKEGCMPSLVEAFEAKLLRHIVVELKCWYTS